MFGESEMVPYLYTMKELVKYTTVASLDDEYKLVASFDLGESLPYLVCLETPKGGVWDNHEWIFLEFYPFLNRYLDRKLHETDSEEFKEDLQWLTEDIAEQIKDVLEEGLKLGWNV